jgi:hypothetical protein
MTTTPQEQPSARVTPEGCLVVTSFYTTEAGVLVEEILLAAAQEPKNGQDAAAA